MYLKSLLIQGFQSHEDSFLEFVKGVNIITGSSNSGKTAILRDLNWIFNDRPLGNSFINNNSSRVNNELVLVDDDGKYHLIVKTKDKKKINVYQVWKDIPNGGSVAGTPDMEFTAFRGDPPLEIRRLLNMGEVNIQEQLSPYFLVLDSPGQVAQYIRTVAGLEDIDKVITEISSRIRTTTKYVAIIETDVSSKSKELANYDRLGLDDLESYVTSCKSIDGVIEKLTSQIQQLKGCLREYHDAQDYLKAYEQIDLNLLENYIQYTKEALQDSMDLDLFTTNLEITILQIKENSRFDKVGEFENLLVQAPALILETNKLDGETYDIFNILRDIKIACKFDQIDDFDDALLDGTLLIETDSKLIGDATILLDTIEEVAKINKYTINLCKEESAYTTIGINLMTQLSDCPYCGQALTIRAKETLLYGESV
jgi:exonuclease SbcC